MRIALAQISPVVGDVEGNLGLVLDSLAQARELRADLVVFPELTTIGYSPKDLLFQSELIRRNQEALRRIAEQVGGMTAVVGFAQPDPSGGARLFNAAAVCRDRRIDGVYHKMLLPNYEVFDDPRYFAAGVEPFVFHTPDSSEAGRSIPVGITICEDLWNDRQFEGRREYGVDPVGLSVKAGAKIIVNLSASPFCVGKHEARESIFSRQAAQWNTPIVYVNQAAGNDDVVYDGCSVFIDEKGRIRARAKAFESDFLVIDTAAPASGRVESFPNEIESIRQAIVFGLRQYVRKCGFRDVLLGLSGGVDSAVVAALAVEAFGPRHVHGFALPSRYSSEMSLHDARELAQNLGMHFDVMPIEPIHQSAETILGPAFTLENGLAMENLQARIRGNLLMALSNRHGWMLLSTGNKSELAVGYCTLYGDMCGGIAPLADVYKSTVWRLGRHINDQGRHNAAGEPLIPQRTLSRPPTAELRPNQTDQDSLPPYPVLDAVLERLIEKGESEAEVIQAGFPAEMVQRIADLFRRAEHKRRQSPMPIKVTSRAFGSGWRMPVAYKL